ncbi:DUF4231 domain-containing protein [Nonomuraea ferruginea]|uniref:DUF4231 domain-containing protein n=1 Tax=Nonomuraea ferruginea TaxID=46174 RepID=A0ABT4SQX6_9ACTN|nr:DUF4231 domain-containing protein [Nonomuraea ferruginea]MDA0639435.1 DUF4231 domain-containing protein [Nonomuraea ferruginea]
MDLAHFPELFHLADRSAIAGQRRFLASTLVRLVSLAIAAVFGTFSIENGLLNIAALITGSALAVALVTEVYLLTARPERHWHEARAAAESAKSLVWRYIVRGQPFGMADGPDDPDALLLSRMMHIATRFRGIPTRSPAEEGEAVTEDMRRIRALTLKERQECYRHGRIKDQRRWYWVKAQRNERWAVGWSVALASIEAVGLVAAVLGAARVIELDVPGIVGALAVAGIAWTQTRQYRWLAQSYAVTALELGVIAIEDRWPVLERDWAHFVDETEETISKEHMLWAASHSIEAMDH